MKIGDVVFGTDSDGRPFDGELVEIEGEVGTVRFSHDSLWFRRRHGVSDETTRVPLAELQDEPPGAGADPFGRPDPQTHPEYWTE